MQLNFDIGITMEFFYIMPTIEHEVFSCILVRSKLGRNTIIKDGQWTGYQHSINYSQQYAIIITTNSKDIKFRRFSFAERKHRGPKYSILTIQSSLLENFRCSSKIRNRKQNYLSTSNIPTQTNERKIGEIVNCVQHQQHEKGITLYVST